MDDAELLARLRRGDESAFDALFRAWYTPLVRASFAVVHDSGVAEEVAQDVMLELWRRREELLAEPSLKGYLFRAVRNRSLNHLRHLRVRQRAAPYIADFDNAEQLGASPVVAEELADAARQAIAALPPRCREVFELSRMHGLRYSEIAETLGVTVKAVEASMTRALRLLREQLSPWLERD